VNRTAENPEHRARICLARLTKRSCLGDYLELGLLVEGERERLTE
jgi:hypothetical protein